MEKKSSHEMYLIAIAVGLAAVLVLYNAFISPSASGVGIVYTNYNTNAVAASSVLASTGGSTGSSADTSPSGEEVSSGWASTPMDGTSAQNSGQASAASSPSQSATGQPSTVNINTASSAQLQTLPGIGEVKANAIIEYRNSFGAFKSVDELINVSGIGEKTLEKLIAYVCV